MAERYLCKITIPSVQKLITYSKKTIDLWAGSFIVNHIMKEILKNIKEKYNPEFIFPNENLLNSNSEIADITNISIFFINLEEQKIKEFIDNTENLFREILIENLLNFEEDIANEDIKNLAEKQIENALNIIIALKKYESDYIQTLEELDKYIATLKGFKYKESKYIEGFKVVNLEIEKNIFKHPDYKVFMDSIYELKPEVIRGAYKCSVCGERIILGATSTDYRGEKFWENLKKKYKIKIGEKERLCGFCLGKRLFRDKVYKKREKVPSISDISMIPLKKKIKEKGLEREIINIFKEIESLKDERDFEKIDGEYLMPTFWENEKNWKTIEEDSQKAEQVRERLNKFYKDHKIKPIYHYAIILMDGDNMGKKLGVLKDYKIQKELSKILSGFSEEVKDIVKENNGYLVYAGGDDVLALLPVDTALKCAKEIRDKFEDKTKAFYEEHIKPQYSDNMEYKFTMSAGVVFAHHRLPLNYVLEQVRQCETEAKNKGKNRVCIKYIKHSYSYAQITKEWDKVEDITKFLKTNIPRTMAYQYQNLVKDLNPEKELFEKLADYLMKKKKIENTIQDTIKKIVDFNEKDDFSSVLKILKFLNENSLEVKDDKDNAN